MGHDELKRSDLFGIEFEVNSDINGGSQMVWAVREGDLGSVLIVDQATGAQILQMSQGPDIDSRVFYLTFCCPKRYFHVDFQLKSYFMAKNQGVEWTWQGPGVIDPGIRIDADWMNWSCSDEQASRLQVHYPEIERLDQFERNSILAKYVLTGLVAKSKKRRYMDAEYNYFYSDYEYKVSLGKVYGYRLPSDDELMALMSV